MIIKFSSQDEMLSQHFRSSEFRCFCCKQGGIDDELLDTLEKLYKYMGCTKLIITSGYRCSKEEKRIGNANGKGYHTTYQAVDINVWKNNNERYTSKEIACALNDLGWNKGIGIISDTAVHIDTRSKRYWFDERKGNMEIKNINGSNDFYEYFGIIKTNKYIEKVCNKFGLNNDFWQKNYNTDLGKKCIIDLFEKISKNI